MTTTIKTQKSKGGLVKLFDEISKNSDDPISDLERIAQLALDDCSIDERRYTILQHRIPFPGFDYETLEEVAKRIQNVGWEEETVTRDRVRQLELNIYQILLEYLPIPRDNEDVLALYINRLPWRKLYGDNGVKAYNALTRKLQIYDRPITVGDVLELFSKTANETGILPITRNYGQKSFEMTYEVFRSVGVELPGVKLSY